MKRILFAICSLGLIWSGCKEHDTPLDFGNKVFKDTTYILSTVPPADPHQVLIEEFTGQGCPACPSGHRQLETIAAANDTFVNIIGLYITDFTQTRPPSGAIYDFRDSVASSIASSIYNGIIQLPVAGIDRTRPSAGASMLLDQGFWPTTVATRRTVADSMNLSISGSYDAGTNTATLNVTTTYLYPVTTTQHLSIAIVEDSMKDIQEDATAPTGFDNDYIFTNVFRGMVTSVPLGDVVSTLPLKEAGRVVQKVYKYNLKTKSPAIKPEHCRVIAFLTADGSGGDYHVIQSAHCKLK